MRDAYASAYRHRPAFRADRFDPNEDAEDDGNLFLTPGLNLYQTQLPF